MTLYANFVNSEIIGEPSELPSSWITPTGNTITGFNNLINTNPNLLTELNWFVVDENCINVEFDTNFESIIYSAWFLEGNILKRNNTKVEHQFSNALSINFAILEKNRTLYEISGFDYSYNGLDLIILTDRESSQPKMASAEIAARNNTRLNSDVWKFIKKDDNTIVVFQLPNVDLLKMTKYVYRKIQDSYNLQTQIANQMLSTANTATLRQQISDGTINLFPWTS